MQSINHTLNLDSDNTDQQGTLFNIIINITTAALKEVFWTLTMNKGIPDKAKPIISMKQESIQAPLHSDMYCKLL